MTALLAVKTPTSLTITTPVGDSPIEPATKTCDNAGMTNYEFKQLPAGTPLPQAYSDEHLLVIDKPCDFSTVPGRGEDKQDSLINRLVVDYPNARIVHRLDYATSGLVIIPLSYESQRGLSQQFEQRQTEKLYIAVVDGLIEQDSGEINLPLICDWPNRPLQMVDHEHGKTATTQYTVIERDEARNRTRVLLKPITGRSHQLRVHMLAIGHPILGDRFYAKGQALEASERLLLHAQEIKFSHPINAEPLTIEVQPPF